MLCHEGFGWPLVGKGMQFVPIGSASRAYFLLYIVVREFVRTAVAGRKNGPGAPVAVPHGRIRFPINGDAFS